MPWDKEVLSCIQTNDKGWITFDSYIALWVYVCTLYIYTSYTHVKTHKLLQVCKQVELNYKSVSNYKLCSHCLFPVVVTSLGQAANNLKQAWWHYQTCYKVVLTSLIQSWYNKNVTRLITQGCYIMTVSNLLEQPCDKSDNINKVVTSC